MSNDYIHDPWNIPKKLQARFEVEIVDEVKGALGTYPKPIPCEKYTSSEAAKKIKRSKSS